MTPAHEHDSRSATHAALPPQATAVVSPDGTAYWDGSAWQPLPGAPPTRASRTAVAGWIAVAVLALAVPGGFVLSAARQAADLTQVVAAEPVADLDDGTSYEEQQRLAAAGGSAQSAPVAPASPVTPMGDRVEAADLCLEETEDRLTRRCPDGSTYEVPAVEADLEGEVVSAAPVLQVLRLGQTGEWYGVRVSARQDGIYTSRQLILTFDADADTQLLLDPSDVYALHGRTRVELTADRPRPMTLNPGERAVLSWYCDGCTYQDELLSVVYAPGGQPVMRFDP